MIPPRKFGVYMGTPITRNEDLGLAIGCWASGQPFEGSPFPRSLRVTVSGVNPEAVPESEGYDINGVFELQYYDTLRWVLDFGSWGLLVDMNPGGSGLYFGFTGYTGFFHAVWSSLCLLEYDNGIGYPEGSGIPNGKAVIDWEFNNIL